MSDSDAPAAIRVLVVEDDEASRALVLELLERSNVDVDTTVAACLDDAIDQVTAAPVDVVLLDLGLPDSRGLDTFRRLHRAAPDAAVIIVSATDDERIARTALRDGAIDYLPKSELNLDVLMRSLRFVIERTRSSAREHALAERLRSQHQDLLRRLALSGTGGVAGRALGTRSLRELSEEMFSSLVQRFGQVVDLQIDENVFGTAHAATPRLRDLAADLGAALAGPRDVVDVYGAALERAKKEQGMSKDRLAQYEDACRVAAFELMGYLVSAYRSRVTRTGALDE